MLLLIVRPPEKRSSPSLEMTVRRSLRRSVDERENDSMDQSLPRDFSDTVRQPSLPAWSKAPGCPSSLLWPRSAVPLQIPCGECVISSHTRAHTLTYTTHPCAHPPFRALGITSTRHSAPLPRHPLYIHIKFHYLQHTHTLSTWDILCSSCALLRLTPGASSCPAPLRLSWSWL